MDMKKKGILFTSVTVIFSVMLISSFIYLNQPSLDHEVDLTRLKVKNTNYFMFQSETFIENLIVTAGKQAINDTLTAMLNTGTYMADYDQQLYNCLETGQFEHSVTHTCDNTSNLSEMVELWESFVKENLNIDLNITIENITFGQTEPWYIDITVNYTLTANDGYASWNTENIRTGKIPVEGFRDPVYEVAVHVDVNDSKYPINITRRPVPETWLENPSSLAAYAKDGKYFTTNYGVSFLNRLRGNFTNDTNGIASYVLGNITVGNFPSIDVTYWQQNCSYFTNDLYKYNFPDYSTAVTYGVNTNNASINNSIIPLIVAQQLNMSNTSVYLQSSGSC